MPRSQTLSPVSDAISCGVSGRGKHGGVTALTGAGERGHCTTLRGRMVCMFVGHHAKLTGVARFGAGRGAPGRAEKMLTSSMKMFVRCS